MNQQLMQVERNWCNPQGIPGRPWFKHSLYAARYTYAHLELPGLTEAAEAGDWKVAAEQAKILQDELVEEHRAFEADSRAAGPAGCGRTMTRINSRARFSRERGRYESEEGLSAAFLAAMTAACCVMMAAASNASAQGAKFEREARARDLGVPFEGTPGPLDAITDVKGVEVGYRTLISGEGKLEVGTGPVRTGVTAVFPRGKSSVDPVFAGWFTENGNGEMTGTDLGGGIRISLRAGDDHKHAQRRRGARRGDCLAIEAWPVIAAGGLVVAAGGGGDMGRLSERHQRISREAGRRGCGDATTRTPGQLRKGTWAAGRE